MKKISLGSDHAGFEIKELIKEKLISQGIEIIDNGAYSTESVDYPDFAHKVASDVESKKTTKGILVCGSGNGVAMTANKYSSVRAALCWEKEIASLARLHNDANVLCLPARFASVEEIMAMVDVFINTEFEGGRHGRRVEGIACK